MSDYFTRLLDRASLNVDTVQPRVAGRFEPAKGLSEWMPEPPADPDATPMGGGKVIDRAPAAETVRVEHVETEWAAPGAASPHTAEARQAGSPSPAGPAPPTSPTTEAQARSEPEVAEAAQATAASRPAAPRVSTVGPRPAPPGPGPVPPQAPLGAATGEDGALPVAGRPAMQQPEIERVVRPESPVDRRSRDPLPGTAPRPAGLAVAAAVAAESRLLTRPSPNPHWSIPAAAAPAPPAPQPSVHVSIGRVEVRAAVQSTARSQPARRERPTMPLDEYLKRRSGSRS